MLSPMTLKEARQLAGLSQAKLASLAGLKSTVVSDIEQGRSKHPSYDVVLRIVRALQQNGMPGLSAESLFPIGEPDVDSLAGKSDESRVAS